eukprot:TRINITY_DN3606_c1_g2_i1.p1 TRINITY_DN3606_c1_g2~~TRINITY_DN3606_c1_g2_i1.p1  ORF type:complete len:603 (+),score=50.73 TRINITY_DN3606_c1_g2_i1:203-2011(+)
MVQAFTTRSLEAWVQQEHQQVENDLDNTPNIQIEQGGQYADEGDNVVNVGNGEVSAPIMIPNPKEGDTKTWPRSFYNAREQSLRRSMESYINKTSGVQFGSQGGQQGEIIVINASQPISMSPQGWPRSWKSATDQLIHSPAAISLASSWDRVQEQEPLLRDYVEDGRLARQESMSYGGQEESKKGDELVDDTIQVIGTSNLFQTILNGLNILCGIGMLATPYAVATAGTASSVLIIVLACICIYTAMLLKYSMDMAGPQCISYPDIGAAAFGRHGRLVTSIVLYAELFAMCVETLILGGTNLNELTNHKTFIVDNSLHFWLIVTAVILCPLTYVRDLRSISIVSACGFFFSLAVLGIVTAFGIKYTGFTHLFDQVIVFEKLPIALGMYLYCYSGHSVFPNLYTGIQNRNQFLYALLCVFGVVTIVYLCTAFIGYSAFGDQTAQQVTLSLHQFGPNSILSQIVGWLVLISPFCSFPLLVAPIAQGFEELIPEHLQSRKQRKNQALFWVATICMRTGITCLALVVALTVPLFAYFASLVGSIFTINISYVFPCLFFLRLAQISGNRVQMGHRVVCIVVPVVGLLAGAAGAFNAFKAINQALRQM